MGADNVKFTKTHEWISAGGTTRRVGISEFAQHQLGDIVYVEFPAGGKEVKAGDEVCIIESCKATSGVYAPLPGKVTKFNTGLADAPETINQSPYDEGWLFEIEVAAGAENAELLSAADYEAFCQQEH